MANDRSDDIRTDDIADINDEEVAGRAEADDEFDDGEDMEDADELDEEADEE